MGMQQQKFVLETQKSTSKTSAKKYESTRNIKIHGSEQTQ